MTVEPEEPKEIRFILNISTAGTPGTLTAKEVAERFKTAIEQGRIDLQPGQCTIYFDDAGGGSHMIVSIPAQPDRPEHHSDV